MAKKKKSSATTAKARAKSKTARKSATKTASRAKAKSPAGKKSARRKKAAPSLGRPKVTGEEMLYMLFHEDYHARQIFDFLRVASVKELEQYSPQEIVRKLSKPITETVNRIRRKLSDKNRCLRDDLGFALEHQQNQKAQE